MKLFQWIKNWFIKKRTFGLIPQLMDKRDYKYKLIGTTFDNADAFDYSEPILNQGRYNACVAYSAGDLLQDNLRKVVPTWSLGWKEFDISQAFIWTMARYEEGTLSKNYGVVARNAFKVISKYGFTSNKYFDFNDGVYNFPSKKVLELAYVYTYLLKYMPGYYGINRYLSAKCTYMRNAISNGSRISLAIPIYDSFMDYKNGVMTEFTGNLLGYHDVVIGAYELTSDGYVFKGKNSWGSSWGEKGYFRISDSLLKKESFDIWTLVNKEEN